jgi:hypothetical protein
MLRVLRMEGSEFGSVWKNEETFGMPRADLVSRMGVGTDFYGSFKDFGMLSHIYPRGLLTNRRGME